MNDPKSLKLYIAVLDEVPDHMVPVLVAHSILNANNVFTATYAGYLDDYSPFDDYPEFPEYLAWMANSYKKVVLRVNRKEFEKIKQLEKIYLGHENTTLNGEKSCAIVCPRYDLPNVLKFAKMWSPSA